MKLIWYNQTKSWMYVRGCYTVVYNRKIRCVELRSYLYTDVCHIGFSYLKILHNSIKETVIMHSCYAGYIEYEVN